MGIIYLLIVISVCMALLFLGAFIWAVKTGQFDDSYSPAVRMLMDDTPSTVEEKPTVGDKNIKE